MFKSEQKSRKSKKEELLDILCKYPNDDIFSTMNNPEIHKNHHYIKSNSVEKRNNYYINSNDKYYNSNLGNKKVKTKFFDVNKYQKLFRESKEISTKRMKLVYEGKRNKHNREKSECFFHPRINQNLNISNSEDFLIRVQKWKENKEKK